MEAKKYKASGGDTLADVLDLLNSRHVVAGAESGEKEMEKGDRDEVSQQSVV